MTEAFYVTVRRDSRTGFLLGPYVTHDEALANVARANAAACEIDPFCGFDDFGTARVVVREGRTPPSGVLNDHIGLIARSAA